MTLATLSPTATLGSLSDFWFRLNFRGRGHSTIAHESDWLFFWIYLISTFFFILLMGLMFYFMFKYRRRPGVAPERSRSHNTFLELSWSVIPTILLVWMFFEGFWGYANAVVPPANAPELVVQGSQWKWTVTYPNGAVSTEESHEMGALPAPIFVVAENQPYTMRMYSIDVIHSFWIPDFRVKFDVFPNRYTTLWFQPQRPDDFDPSTLKTLMRDVRDDKGNPVRDAAGNVLREPWRGKDGSPYSYSDHWVFCAEYCGSNHSEMLAVCRVVSAEAYDAILADWAEPRGDPPVVGEKLYKIKGCNSCHSVDGSRNVGPSWKDLYGKTETFSDGSTALVEPNYLRESILEPGKKIVATYPNQMQSYQNRINEQQLEAIFAYMRTISIHAKNAPGEAAAGETPPAPAGGDKPVPEGAATTTPPKPAPVPGEPAQQQPR
jgi:cytochrome c oxidase subunit II